MNLVCKLETLGYKVTLDGSQVVVGFAGKDLPDYD